MAEYKLGLDIGSTTIKIVLVDGENNILFDRYRRHFSDVRGELFNLFKEVAQECGEYEVTSAITGSGGLTVATLLDLPFVQEVVAGARATQKYIPQADVVLELGGEDAKITYMKPSLEQRMNGTCAGGTGAFIDQMATLLNTDPMGLNELAESYNTLYPIAARCGVFAKTDVQPLINEGAAKEDIAASIFQSVVNQTISGLACGRPIRGNVAFLGGPLHYLTQLRQRFIETLHLSGDAIIHPENSHLFVALGAALMAEGKSFQIKDLPDMLTNAGEGAHETRRLRPLFETEEEHEAFNARHAQKNVERAEISTAEGACYLGLDAGSTTIKAVLIDDQYRMLYSHYHSNEGSPLDSAVEIARDIYDKLPEKAYIAGACVTGYGEAIIKEALKLDLGEIETMAHYKAAEFFNNEVDLIIDIGGQDMKCLHIKDRVVDGIMLNEACSSGCGSFLQTFAYSLGIPIQEFAQEALVSRNPVDLGTRCTVFMNSRVKQAQKEGATVGDISAGLSYSVVKNALYKVIKVKDPADLGKNIVVQGGTFKNDAILRTFELELGREVVRPDIAELMGAFGAALLAKKEMKGKRSGMLGKDELSEFTYKGSFARCGKCENRCMLTITTFEDGRKFVSGNRCEKGSGVVKKNDLPDLYDYKLKRVFDYESLPEDQAPNGTIGIPRALNIFENYPFWHAMFTKLGFRVVLSDPSNHAIFEKGMETISSDTVCYPAKLIHGHIENLAEKGVKKIFYPCIPYERKEFGDSNNHYNCPVVTSYPEVIKNNMDVLSENGIEFINFFVALDEQEFMPKKIMKEFGKYGITEQQAQEASDAAYAELDRFKQDMREQGEKTIQWLKETGNTGIVLAGRPYHVDAEINHGIPSLITSYGLAVLTEDSVAHLGHLERPVRVMDQWAYHTRLYEAAAAVARYDCLQMVQLNSFGCGLDAITTDQVHEIISAADKIYTVLKIDEISNLGAAKIRLRSLIAALKEKGEEAKEKPEKKAEPKNAVWHRRIFTQEMREKGTIVCPQMAPLQFQFLKQAFDPTGYNFTVLTEVTKEDIDVGLKYVNNDACYPTIIVVGQLVNAFITGKLDPDNTVIMLTQTGGGCRASNYLAFLRKALKEAGFPQVVVVSINFSGLEKNPGFKFTGGLAMRLLLAIPLGDLLQKLLLATRPYEKNKGETDALFDKWVAKVQDIVKNTRYFGYRKASKQMVRDFEAIERTNVVKPKVGIVGEILVKYHPDANNHAIEVIEREGGEAVMPALMEFFTYSLYSCKFKHEEMGKSKGVYKASMFGIWFVNWFRNPIQRALRKSKYYTPYPNIHHLAEQSEDMISCGNCTGEGWFLTAEMLHLIEEGAPNIICVQPFACLPNHVVGKGMIRGIRNTYPQANIVAVDYDPGASEVNQLNRIKLMIYSAFENLKMEQEQKQK
ncbi:MAG: acyl-CoA dehydratase activase-related protein [Christensenella sp.]|uniref:acyl-CoA dehydratase activase-related protein n=1 Tax=Christensenella sp. TaxID=1935934 RepID=UPI002B200A5D|nr:acyl-CoA dehydratase activase-related protein [Christensenella sp.]MEA5004746.1 acyl-CoA dehydratase activase-related protein [Christensenella sp.]